MDGYIPQSRPRLSDEAAAEVLDFLYDLVADFESTYADQIWRHRHTEAQCCRDLRQLALFDEPTPDPDPDSDPF